MPPENIEKGKALIKKTEERINTKERKPFIPDGVIKKLKPGMRAFSRKILAALRLKRGMLIRFHNDADGVCGGLAIWSIAKQGKAIGIQNDSAVYETENALRDRGILGQSHFPLVILVDFGANDESVEGLRLLKEADFEIIVIDHHPPSEKAKEIIDCLLSPFNVGGGSEYSAGYLCAEIAKCSGSSAREMDELSRTSLTGDRSLLYLPKEEDAKRALVLDYMSSRKEFLHTLEFYGNALKDNSLFSSAYSEARDKMEEAGRESKRYRKMKKVGPFSVCFVNLDGFTKKGEFPSKGKAIGIVFDDLMLENPTAPFVAIGHGAGIINFRVSRKAIETGFSALRLIGRLKKELLTGIESGGGHHAAASMRIKKGFERIMLDEIENLIKSEAQK